MKKQERVTFVTKLLNHYFPSPKMFLFYKNSFTMLIAVLLSAHTTDKIVNKITKFLFEKADTPEKMKKLSIEEIEKFIRPCGLYKFKAKAIYTLSCILIEKYNSQVPNTFKDLESLPGVGHKTASVVMMEAFNIPAFPVDTHVSRLAKRWKLSSGKNVVQIEKDLKKLFLKKEWKKVHLQMISFGRTYCKAKGHDKKNCPICREIT